MHVHVHIYNGANFQTLHFHSFKFSKFAFHLPALNEPLPDLIHHGFLDVWALCFLDLLLDGAQGLLVLVLMIPLCDAPCGFRLQSQGLGCVLNAGRQGRRCLLKNSCRFCKAFFRTIPHSLGDSFMTLLLYPPLNRIS